MPKFGTKNALFGYFCEGTSKKCCHTRNQHPPIRLIAKFCQNTKMAKFWTEKALFGYFWDTVSKNYCHI